MNHGSLFSGIGGFDLAAQWMGWDNVFHCEYNPFGRRVLNHYWPESISYEDVTTTDFNVWEGSIDILSGGFPCQPYSTAGKRKGKEDDRHLWPEMLRAVREIQPRYVVGENVRGLLSWNGGLVFDEVQSDLEAEGYEVIPFLLPASGVNAPHERYRIWFVAFNSECEPDGGDNTRESIGKRLDLAGYELVQERRKQGSNHAEPSIGNATDSSIEYDGRNIRNKEVRQESEFGNCLVSPNAPNASNEQLQRSQLYGSTRSEGAAKRQSRQPCGSIPSEWEEFPTQSPICGRNDGLPTELDGITISKWRQESIKAYGNAIVPQVAYQIFKAIAECESLMYDNAAL